MLKNLQIRNFALVDDLDLDFEKGLSVLTGETGAGKSVIITALGLVLGDRADKEQVRHGTTKATIKATFAMDRFSKEFREEFDEYIEDGFIHVIREINRDGGSKVKINGVAASLTRLQHLTYPFAEILGQHSSRLLTEEDQHLVFLDDFADITPQKSEVSDLFNVWQTTYQELKSLRGRLDEVAAERELMQFQKDEIEKAEIRVGEEDELNQRKKLLESARTLIESSATIVESLDGEQQSALDLLKKVRKDLERMAADMATPAMADLRNVYDAADVKAAGFLNYSSVGRQHFGAGVASYTDKLQQAAE